MRSTLIAVAVAAGSVTTATTATAAVSPEPPAIIQTATNEYQHFFVDNDAVGIYGVSEGQLRYRGQVAFGGEFSPWENLGGSELSGRPTLTHDREIVRGAQLTVRQGAGAAVYQHYADNPPNNRFINRGGSIAGTHLVSARDARRGTRLFATTPDGQVVTNGFGNLEWASLNNPKTGLPPTAAFDEVREGSDVVIRAADGHGPGRRDSSVRPRRTGQRHGLPGAALRATRPPSRFESRNASKAITVAVLPHYDRNPPYSPFRIAFFCCSLKCVFG
ncbi:hypothetical protein ABZ345_02450 [Lentzea sp. NPDC005914]|uniref:hypothetical protein n=1 Tax=Lentzea sp. NPDC005914 TaxID=3154572 RepID=UPI00340E4335